MEDLNLLDIRSIKLRVEVAREHGIDLLVGQLSSALDDTLSDPSVLVGDHASVGVDFEDNTDGKTVLTWHQRADL